MYIHGYYGECLIHLHNSQVQKITIPTYELRMNFVIHWCFCSRNKLFGFPPSKKKYKNFFEYSNFSVMISYFISYFCCSISSILKCKIHNFKLRLNFVVHCWDSHNKQKLFGSPPIERSIELFRIFESVTSKPFSYYSIPSEPLKIGFIQNS